MSKYGIVLLCFSATIDNYKVALMSCYVQCKEKSQRLYQWCHHDTLTTHCGTLNRNVSHDSLKVAMTVQLNS